ncbi:MAG: SRPBCC family protein [Balneolaceae bacterium]|jgi:uncharacterized protein YndB with AHSA1/START domain
MSQITVTRTIDAPVEMVFRTISDITHFSKAVPDIVDVDFLSEVKSGVGTQFRETRNMNGREVKTELEVTEFKENDHIRLVSDTSGTVWDSIFTVREDNGRTLLTLVMDAKPYKLLPKVTNPLMKSFIKKALEKDMDAVKKYCER